MEVMADTDAAKDTGAAADTISQTHLCTDKDVLMQKYVQWAPGYDADVLAVDYVAPVKIVEIATALPYSSPTVLDIGCGSGLVADVWNKHTARIDGCDLSEEMLLVADKKGVYTQVFTHDATVPVARRETAYDIGVCCGCFTHGHVGPDAIEPLLASFEMKHFVFSVRASFAEKSDFDRTLADLEERGQLSSFVKHSDVAYIKGDPCVVYVVKLPGSV